MSEEIMRPAYNNVAPAPRIEILSGQFLFKVRDHDGAVHEKLLSAAAVREAFTKITVSSGWIPPEIRNWGTGRSGDWAVMYMEPQRHTLEMVSDAPEAKGGVVRISVPLPGLVMFGIGNKYFLWAVKTEELDPYREIYHAPLPNVEPSGLICFGTHQPPRCSATAIKQAWRIFITTPFNNHRCDGKSKRSTDDVRVVLRDMARAAEPAHYPVQDLERQVSNTGITLDKALKGLLESGDLS
jgi:hypothetical protein